MNLAEVIVIYCFGEGIHATSLVSKEVVPWHIYSWIQMLKERNKHDFFTQGGFDGIADFLFDRKTLNDKDVTSEWKVPEATFLKVMVVSG